MQIEFFTIAVLTLLMSLGSSTLAHGEGLTAHARSAEFRLK